MENTMSDNLKEREELAAFDAAVESARLLGAADAKRWIGDFTDEDARFVVAMHQSIEKHRAAIEAIRAAVPAETDVQWQKRHPIRTEGAWENTYEHDAKWWRDRSKGWEIRMLATAPQPVAQPGEPIMAITGYQLREALDFLAPDGTAEQLEQSVCIQSGPERSFDAGTPNESTDPAGLYCWLEDYPEEGSIALIGDATVTQAKPEQAEQQWQPIETAPKDGTSLMLKAPSGRIADGVFDLKYKVWAWPYVMVEPTHWVPLAGIYKCPQPIREDELVTLYDEAPTSDAEMIEFARAVERYHGIAASPQPKD